MGFLLLALMEASWASPYGLIAGAAVGLIAGLIVPLYLLNRIVVLPALAVIMLLGALLGCYLFALAGGFLVGWAEHFISRFS